MGKINTLLSELSASSPADEETLIGIFLDSSNTEWHEDHQRKLECITRRLCFDLHRRVKDKQTLPCGNLAQVFQFWCGN